MNKMLSLCAVLVLSACHQESAKDEQKTSPEIAGSAQESARTSSTAVISPTRLLEHIRVLSSDEFEGRAPGTPGEEKTVAYITEQFKALGLAPGNPDGSYVQQVPLVGLITTPTLSMQGCAKDIGWQSPDEYVAFTTRVNENISVKNSDLVFVGYGVQAPEYGWDDYKGLDVKGKTLVMLINDPAIPDPADPTQLDAKMFKGKAMTYYGRWSYKYEIAAKLGAAAAIIIHETEPAAYPYEVVRNNGLRESFSLKSADGNADELGVRSWIREDKARALLSACGQDFDALKKAALKPDFQPVALAAKTSVELKNTIREVMSKNVIARAEGTDPAMKSSHVIYTAHWDHLGKSEDEHGTHIFNGAVDNASGIAMLIEIAGRYVQEAKAMKRSALFLAVTAEEQGLLGAQYYAANPLYPLQTTVANINMDAMQPWGRAKDLQVVGYGQTTMDQQVEKHAKAQDRTVIPDTSPEKGGYFRSDHFAFVKKGVPALYIKGGVDIRGKESGYGMSRAKEYTAEHYHKESDVVNPAWDLSGMAEDADLLYLVGRDLVIDGQSTDFQPGSEFNDARKTLLAK